jgi:hypothetical protein
VAIGILILVGAGLTGLVCGGGGATLTRTELIE